MKKQTFEELVAEHKEVADNLANLKQREMDLRVKLINANYEASEYGSKSKVVSIDGLPDGQSYKVSMSKGTSLKLDKKKYASIKHLLTRDDEKEVITLEPKMSESKMKKISKASKLWKAVDEKPKAVTVKYTIIADPLLDS